jgi:hypothetical protein
MPAVKKARPQKKGAAQRKQAPKNISVIDEYYQDDSAVIMAKAKAALGETKAAGMDFMYGSSNPIVAEKLSLKGWVRVVTEEDGNTKNWQHGIDPLMMRAKGQSEKEHNMAAEVARSQLRNSQLATGTDLEAE